MSDAVHSPSHYTQGSVECIDAIKSSMTQSGFADYCKGNVIKYLFRWEYKGGLQDLKKAQVYLGWMVETAEAFATNEG